MSRGRYNLDSIIRIAVSVEVGDRRLPEDHARGFTLKPVRDEHQVRADVVRQCACECNDGQEPRPKPRLGSSHEHEREDEGPQPGHVVSDRAGNEICQEAAEPPGDEEPDHYSPTVPSPCQQRSCRANRDHGYEIKRAKRVNTRAWKHDQYSGFYSCDADKADREPDRLTCDLWFRKQKREQDQAEKDEGERAEAERESSANDRQ